MNAPLRLPPAAVLHEGDCIASMRLMPDASVDAVVCDPPYGLGFMGKHWDAADNVAFRTEIWIEALRVLRPGGHLLAFSGTRTYHRMAVAIEDAGFEIRDQLGWLYGTGFPKSLDVSKAIDKALGAERAVIGERMRPDGKSVLSARGGDEVRSDGWDRPWRHDADRVALNGMETAPGSPEAAAWEGWGTALKPAWEPICMARKPLDGTVAANVMAHGTGGLNIGVCRIGTDERIQSSAGPLGGYHGSEGLYAKGTGATFREGGRWPANVVHDGSEEVEEAFAAFGSRGAASPVRGTEPSKASVGNVTGVRERVPGAFHGGAASRFFYCAKASRAERAGTDHPTVKPVSLMRWLVRLVTPPGGIVLDPFAGSGTTGAAALAEGLRAVLCEMDPGYAAHIRKRLGIPSSIDDWDPCD